MNGACIATSVPIFLQESGSDVLASVPDASKDFLAPPFVPSNGCWYLAGHFLVFFCRAGLQRTFVSQASVVQII